MISSRMEVKKHKVALPGGRNQGIKLPPGIFEGLSEQRRIFILEYQRTRNGKRSAIAAGYSVKTATVQASRLLTNRNVKRALETLSKAITDVQIANVVERKQLLTQIARGQYRKTSTKKGTMLLARKR